MEDTKKDNIVYINDKEYNADNFDSRQKYLVAQIRVCQDRVSKLQFDFDREKASLDHFTNALIATVEISEKDQQKVS